MWWPIMESLGDWMKADSERLDGIAIRYGRTNPMPEGDFVELRYGGAAGGNPLADRDEGQNTLWVDGFVHLDRQAAQTDADTGIGYQRLHALEQNILASIDAWWQETQIVSGAHMRVGVKQINPDGEHYRDSERAGVRIVLTIDWQTGEN